MWDNVGVLRTGKELEKAIEEIERMTKRGSSSHLDSRSKAGSITGTGSNLLNWATCLMWER